jgi:hypothetical protein
MKNKKVCSLQFAICDFTPKALYPLCFRLYAASFRAAHRGNCPGFACKDPSGGRHLPEVHGRDFDQRSFRTVLILLICHVGLSHAFSYLDRA